MIAYIIYIAYRVLCAVVNSGRRKISMKQSTYVFDILENNLLDQAAVLELDEQDLEQVTGGWGFDGGGGGAAAAAAAAAGGSAAAAAAAAGGSAAAAAAAASGHDFGRW
jgi:hypothetical protein